MPVSAPYYGVFLELGEGQLLTELEKAEVGTMWATASMFVILSFNCTWTTNRLPTRCSPVHEATIPAWNIGQWQLGWQPFFLTVQVDAALRRQTYVYNSFRSKQSIGPVQVWQVKPGTFRELKLFTVAHTDASLNQFKVARVVRRPETAKFLLERLLL